MSDDGDNPERYALMFSRIVEANDANGRYYRAYVERPEDNVGWAEPILRPTQQEAVDAIMATLGTEVEK